MSTLGLKFIFWSFRPTKIIHLVFSDKSSALDVSRDCQLLFAAQNAHAWCANTQSVRPLHDECLREIHKVEDLFQLSRNRSLPLLNVWSCVNVCFSMCVKAWLVCTWGNEQHGCDGTITSLVSLHFCLERTSSALQHTLFYWPSVCWVCTNRKYVT